MGTFNFTSNLVVELSPFGIYFWLQTLPYTTHPAFGDMPLRISAGIGVFKIYMSTLANLNWETYVELVVYEIHVNFYEFL